MAIELVVVRLREAETPEDGVARVESLEGVAVDDAGWQAMVALASTLVGTGAESVREDRKWGSVQASAGPILVDVVFHGHAANVYYDAPRGAGVEPLRSVLAYARGLGFTVLELGEYSVIDPDDDLADLLDQE